MYSSSEQKPQFSDPTPHKLSLLSTSHKGTSTSFPQQISVHGLSLQCTSLRRVEHIHSLQFTPQVPPHPIHSKFRPPDQSFLYRSVAVTSSMHSIIRTMHSISTQRRQPLATLRQGAPARLGSSGGTLTKGVYSVLIFQQPYA